MDVFIQELKRQFNLKRFSIYALSSIILAILWAWFIVGGATEDFMQKGCYKGYKGKQAIELAAKDRNATAGEMSEDKFQNGCDIFLKSLKGQDEKSIVINKNLLKYAVYADKLVTEEYKLRNITGKSMKNLLNIPEDAGRHFYENENLYYCSYIDKNAHNESEKRVALSMWNNVKKPYIYYSGFEIWNDGIGHIIFFSFVLMIMVGIFAATIIVKDKENGIDEIITSTVKGRRGLTIPKIIIPWIMASLIYIFGVGIYILILRWLLPLNALNTSIQISGENFIACDLGEALKNVFILGWIGILTVASFSTWISSISKKSSIAIEISVFTVLGSILLGLFVNGTSFILNLIDILLPGSILFSYVKFIDLEQFPMVTLLGKVFWMPSVCIVISGIIFLFSTAFTVLIYRRRWKYDI